MNTISKFFKLEEKGTNVRTEVMAGITTFLTMAYIVALNPNLITGFGFNGGKELWNAVFLATVLSSGITTILMGLFANQPYALSSGMGLNSYFAVVAGQIATAAGVGYIAGVQAALSIILIEGIVFLALSLFKVREKIVDAIPHGVRLGISAGIGLMLVNIGLGSNAGLDVDASYYMLSGFFGKGASESLATLGAAEYKKLVLYVITMLVGVILIAVLSHKKVTGSILFGVLGASALYWAGSAIFLGVNPFASLAKASWLPPFKDMIELTFFKFNFTALFKLGYFTVIMTILSFCMVDMFDTIGTLYGTAKAADMLDENDNVPEMGKCLLTDAVGTCFGACTGTSTITTFVESSAGVKAGGRTGLTSVVTGLLFLACMFIAPIAAIIPAPATSAALIYVGALMISSLKEVDYDDPASSVPVVFMLISMPITSSIGSGIGLGLIMYSLIKICRGEWKDVSWVTMLLSVLFLCKFFIIF